MVYLQNGSYFSARFGNKAEKKRFLNYTQATEQFTFEGADIASVEKKAKDEAWKRRIGSVVGLTCED